MITKSDPKMAIETTRELFNALVNASAPKGSLLKESGIDLTELEESESRYPVKYHLNLWDAGEKLLRKNAIGIQMGSCSDPYSRGIVGLAFAASANLEEAISNKIRYTKILADHIDLGYEKGTDTFSINYSILEGYFHRNEIERVFAGFLNWVRVFVNNRVYPKRLSFQYAKPENVEAYEKHFQCPMTFDSPDNVIAFDIKLLDYQAKQYNEYLYSILKARADKILTTLDTNANFIENIKSMIAGRLSNGNFSIDDIASSLNVSKRTLHRKLSDENVTYQALLDDMRKKMAISYLTEGACSASNLPYLVGYSDTRSFNRAFKRWTGQSVSEYSKDHLNQN